MSAIVTIGAVTTSVITYQGQHVCTTQQLAQLYGTDNVRIQQNHARNATRFEEGKHFIKATGEDLKSLRLSLSELQISSKARSLILWKQKKPGTFSSNWRTPTSLAPPSRTGHLSLTATSAAPSMTACRCTTSPLIPSSNTS